LCSYIIDLKVIFDLDIEDIQLIPGSKLGLFGLLLGSLDQNLLCLFLFLDELALPAGSIGLQGLGGSCGAQLGLLLFGILVLLFFFLVFFLFLCLPREKVNHEFKKTARNLYHRMSGRNEAIRQERPSANLISQST
jgi:hypothetical protein